MAQALLSLYSLIATAMGLAMLVAWISQRKLRRQAEQKLQAEKEASHVRQLEFEEFLYVASHDLRAPLVNLRGFSTELTRALETLRPAMTVMCEALNGDAKPVRNALEQDIPEAIGFINESVTRLDHLTGELLQLSRRYRPKAAPTHEKEN